MRARRALLVMMVLLPMLAWAGWRPVGTVNPPVRDVEVVDSGVVLAVSLDRITVWQVTDAGVTTLNSFDGAFVGGGFYGNCVLGLTTGGDVTPSQASCGTTTNLGPGTWTGFKMLSSAPFSVAVTAAGGLDDLYSGPGAAPGWFNRTNSGVVGNVNRTLQVRRIGGVDYVAMQTGAPIDSLHMSVDGGTPVAVTGTVSWRDAAPFPLNGAPAVLGVAQTSLVLIRDYRTPTIVPLTWPAGTTPRYVSSSGLASMATTAGTTGTVLAPIPDPARLVETWVVRSGPPGGIGGKVHCFGDHACESSNDAGVVWLWTNDEPPTIAVSLGVQPDGGAALRLIADAGDGDGDPIFVSWDAGTSGLMTGVAGVDDGTQVDLALPSTCAQLTVEATVTDGLPGHERSVSFVPPAPRGALVLTGGVPSVPAGGDAVSFSASVDGGCVTPTIDWSTSDGGTGTGATFAWVPPAHECNADGGLVTVTATASWPSGAPATTALSQQVLVEPWGAPEAPVFVGGTQQPNTTASYLSSGLDHQCTGSAVFPGTELVWTIDAGGANVVELVDGLQVVAPSSCVELVVSASAYRQLAGPDAGRPSQPGSLVVTIPAAAAPLDPSTPFSITVNGDAGVLFGVLEADAGCLAERGVSALVTASLGGTIVGAREFEHDGGEWAWSLEASGGCLGGTFDVVAELLVDGGSSGALAQGSFTLPFTPVIVGAQSISQLEVVCGAGARGTVALLPAPDSCASADVQWRVMGPAVVTPSGTGASFEVQTEALDFSTVGQQLAIEWSADAGPGNGDSATYTIDLGVQPFLEVGVRARPPLRREDEAMTLEITLRNTTSCAVDGLSVTLPLSGGAPIGDSVLVDDVRRASRETDLGPVVDGVSVPAGGESIIQVSVRPRLLSSPTVEPVASLNGYVVSTLLPVAEPARGCGCSSADLTTLLGALLLLLRKRRA